MAALGHVGSLDSWLDASISTSVAGLASQDNSTFPAPQLVHAEAAPDQDPLRGTRQNAPGGLREFAGDWQRPLQNYYGTPLTFSTGDILEPTAPLLSAQEAVHEDWFFNGAGCADLLPSRSAIVARRRSVSFDNTLWAASLPVVPSQESVSLSALCAAALSPPAAPQAALALAAPKPGRGHAAVDAAVDAGEADAATAAFAHSMTWAVDEPQDDSTGGSQRRGRFCRGTAAAGPGPRTLAGHTAAGAAATRNDRTKVAPARAMRQAGMEERAEASPENRVHAVQALVSVKRGLYEGTVRRGSPRNTWRWYCSAR